MVYKSVRYEIQAEMPGSIGFMSVIDDLPSLEKAEEAYQQIKSGSPDINLNFRMLRIETETTVVKSSKENG